MLSRSSSFLVVVCLCGFVSFTTAHETLTTTVLFDREIVRILNRHCVMCHAENGPSFPLETYEQTWLQGRKIRSAVIRRHMPPWAAVPGYGQFINDNNLTLRETQFMVSWVEGLGPRNSGTVFANIADSPGPRASVRARAEFGHWQLGQPPLVRRLEPNTIEAGQPGVIRRSVIDLGLTAERRVRAIEYLPGDPRVVRAAFFTVQETGQWIGSWTPWYAFVDLPSGVAYRLPAGSHVVAEIHYRGAKERVVDQGSLGLFFADKPAPATPSDLVLEARTADSRGRFRSELRIAADARLIALRPEAGPAVKSIEVSARRPDGGTDVLLFARDLPADWPTPYIFKEAVLVRRGTVLSVTSHGGAVKLTASRY
jgi:hypothetical protein